MIGSDNLALLNINGQINECFKKHRQFPRPQINLTPPNNGSTSKSNKDKSKQKQAKSEIQQIQQMKKYINTINKFAHSYLYCRDPTEMLTVSQSRLLQNERSKYINYINKNYKYKIPEEFNSRKLMKQRRDELLERMRLDRIKKLEMDEQVHAKKRNRTTKSKQPQPKLTKRVKPNNNNQPQPKNQKKTKRQPKKTAQPKPKQAQKAVQKQAQPQHEEVQKQVGERSEQEIVQDEFESEQDLVNRDLDDLEDDEQ